MGDSLLKEIPTFRKPLCVFMARHGQVIGLVSQTTGVEHEYGFYRLMVSIHFLAVVPVNVSELLGTRTSTLLCLNRIQESRHEYSTATLQVSKEMDTNANTGAKHRSVTAKSHYGCTGWV